MSGTTTKGAWRLQDVRDNILKGEWVTYSATYDPGTLWAWGSNCNDAATPMGNLGTSDSTHKSSPTQVPGTGWTQVTAHRCHTLARKGDGTLWSWGYNAEGQLANNLGPAQSRSSPIAVPGTQWAQVSGSTYRNSIARKTDGTLWVWGSGTNGVIGNSCTYSRSSPIQVPGTQWTDISGSTRNSYAIKSNGTLWSWGLNGNGQLGTCPVGDAQSSPVQVPGTSWTDVIAGDAATHALGLKSDGTLWVWGRNYSGQLGDNTRTDRSSPVQVPGTQWVDAGIISGGSFGRKSDGTLWGWGTDNLNGITKSSPVQIPGTQWLDISCGGGHTLALKTNNTLWVWGANNKGQLGDGTTTSKSSPIQIPGTNWVGISSSYVSSFARKSP